MSEVIILVLNPSFYENYHVLWDISANVNNCFGLFTIHFFFLLTLGWLQLMKMNNFQGLSPKL